MRVRLSGCITLLTMSLVPASSASACAVCFGDPESAMAKGAVAGVAFMIGVVGFVFTLFTATGLYWLHRCKTLTPPTDAA